MAWSPLYILLGVILFFGIQVLIGFLEPHTERFEERAFVPSPEQEGARVDVRGYRAVPLGFLARDLPPAGPRDKGIPAGPNSLSAQAGSSPPLGQGAVHGGGASHAA